VANAIVNSRAPKFVTDSGYAIGNVAKIIEVCKSASSAKVVVVHDPARKNPSHSLIRRLPHNDDVVMLKLAEDVFTRRFLHASLVRSSDS
jgi:2-C-methyl-D-erythritol 4-phosphate cytidylyltransferase